MIRPLLIRLGWIVREGDTVPTWRLVAGTKGPPYHYVVRLRVFRWNWIFHWRAGRLLASHRFTEMRGEDHYGRSEARGWRIP